MYKAAVRRLIRRNVEALGRGEVQPLLAAYADDAVLVFPGTSTWGGEHRGKAAIGAFLRRFVDSELQGSVEDILVNGPPWRTRVCVVFSDRATGDDGAVVYENRAVLFAVIRWGKLTYQEDFEDTHKVAAFDAYLAGRAGAAGG
jgi:ketosteroid isomerase-like protein